MKLPDLGSSIRARRLERRLSQTALALESGVAQATISNIERGRVGVEIGTLLRLAEVLDVPASELLGRTRGSLHAELRRYGLPLAGGRMPWAVRRPEEVLALALAEGDPRVVDRLAALVFLRPEMEPALMVAFAEVHRVRQRLGWLVALARHVAEIQPDSAAGVILLDRRLDDWLDRARSALDWDGIGRPVADRTGLPPLFKRWRIDYDRRLEDLVGLTLDTVEHALRR